MGSAGGNGRACNSSRGSVRSAPRACSERKLAFRSLSLVTDLKRCNNELRAALILASKEIRKLNFGKSDTPLLRKLREVLRESRIVAAKERQKVRVRLSCVTKADICTPGYIKVVRAVPTAVKREVYVAYGPRKRLSQPIG